MVNVRLSYFVLTLACFGLLHGLFTFFIEPVFGFGSFVSVVISGSVVALVGAREWRKNRRSLATFAAVMVAIPFAVAVLMLVISPERSLQLWVLCGVSVVALGVIGRVLWHEEHFQDRVPNGLSERFLDEDTFEDDGVQWAVQATGHDAASPLEAIVHLQNNIDAERTVRIQLVPDGGLFGRAKCIRVAEIPAVRLPPGAEATVSIPFVATETRPRKQLTLYVHVRAKGVPGPRNRRQRVGPGPRPMSRWLMVFGVLAGQFSFQRGGMRIALRSSGAAEHCELSATQVELRLLAAQPPELFDGLVQRR